MEQKQWSTNSWHFRLNKWFYGKDAVMKYDHTTMKYVPRTVSICRYSWSLVLAISFSWLALIWRGLSKIDAINDGAIKGIIMFTGAMVVFGGALAVVGHHMWFLPPAIAGGIVLLILIVIGFMELGTRWNDRKSKQVRKMKSPNIVVESVKAWKSDHCPLITFVDSDE